MRGLRWVGGSAAIAAGFVAAHLATAPARALEVPTVTTTTLPATPLPTTALPTTPLPTTPLPTTPLPTLPVPTVPLPTATVPPPPSTVTVTSPAGTATVEAPLPGVTTARAPEPVSSQPAPTAAAHKSAPALESPSAASGQRTSASGADGGVRGPRAATGVRGTRSAGAGGAQSRPIAVPPALRATATRRAGRPSVRLRFGLAKPRRMFVIVRGPLPSCRVAGVITVRGRRGVNALDFRGRVRNRKVKSGVYVLTISPIRRVRAGDPAAAVEVVPAGGAVPLRRRVAASACVDAADAHAPASLARYEPARHPAAAAAAAAAAAPRARELNAASKESPVELRVAAHNAVEEEDDADRDEVLGVSLPRFGARDDVGLAESVAAVALVVLLAASLLALATLVVRFVTGSWNP